MICLSINIAFRWWKKKIDEIQRRRAEGWKVSLFAGESWVVSRKKLLIVSTMDCHSGAWNAKTQSINDSTFKHTRCLVVVFPPSFTQSKNVIASRIWNLSTPMVSHRNWIIPKFLGHWNCFCHRAKWNRGNQQETQQFRMYMESRNSPTLNFCGAHLHKLV